MGEWKEERGRRSWEFPVCTVRQKAVGGAGAGALEAVGGGMRRSRRIDGLRGQVPADSTAIRPLSEMDIKSARVFSRDREIRRLLGESVWCARLSLGDCGRR